MRGQADSTTCVAASSAYKTLYRAPWRLPTLTRPPPRVTDMVDEVEEGVEVETEEYRRLRVREESALP